MIVELENIRHYGISIALCLDPGRGTIGHRCFAGAQFETSLSVMNISIFLGGKGIYN